MKNTTPKLGHFLDTSSLLAAKFGRRAHAIKRCMHWKNIHRAANRFAIRITASIGGIGHDAQYACFGVKPQGQGDLNYQTAWYAICPGVSHHQKHYRCGGHRE